MSEQTPFYQTTPMPLVELQQHIEKAKKQDERVMLILTAKAYPMTSFKIWQTYKSLWRERIKEESLRRSLTNLATSGKVIKCDETEMGGYGIKIHKWRLA